MKATELREMNESELKQRLADEQSALEELTFKKAVTGQVENPAQFGLHRREIARIKTILNELASAK